MFSLSTFVKKYKNWIILGGIGVGAYIFFFAKLFHDKKDSLYEVIMMQVKERNDSNIVE